MDFNDTPEEAVFRAKARSFLDANVERRQPGEPAGYRRGQDGPNFVADAREYQRKKYEAGLAGISWPADWGGQGGTTIQQVIFTQEESKYKTHAGLFSIGLGMCMPTICTWGTQEQRDRYVPPALAAKEIWCQLFSEPAGGSDLGALRTRAVQDGGDWVINGQKIWTSGAHYADWGILVTRTNPDVPKHEGLTFFVLDMRTPGVDIRPIKQISGASHFNEVYFTDVRIPDSQRLGPVGAGWRVAITTLMNERFTVGDSVGPDFEELMEVARIVELEDGMAIDDSAVKEKLADFYVRSQGLRFTTFRSMTSLSKGQTPGPESSIGKLVTASKLQDVASYGLDLLGMGGAEMGQNVPLAGIFEEAMLYAPAMRIAGGTDEILRNIIAERVLGLPADMRADKGMPFRDVPTGAR